MLGLTIVAAAVAIYAAFQSRLRTTIVGGPLVFVILGLALSSEGLGVLDLDIDTGIVTILLKATLVILLFTEASELKPRRMRGEISIPGRLLGIGMPFVMILGTVAAALIFDGIGIWEAAVVAALLAPTDAALGVPVVSNKRVPVRIRRSLIVESGLNDGLAVPFAFAFAAAGEVFTSDATGADAFTFLVEQIGFGLVVGFIVGAAGAKILKETSDRGWTSSASIQIAFIALAGLAYAAAELIHGNGFISAWVAGLVFAFTARDAIHPQGFAARSGELLTLASFFVFGVVMLAPALSRVEASWVIYGLASLALIRPASVAVSMIGSGLRPPTVAYMGWFGPRGIASLILAVLVLKDFTLENIDAILDIVSITVGLSVLLHGISAWPGSQAYANWFAKIEPGALENNSVDKYTGDA
jgi:NhaP-type Na+/H+ or K+/H+ antiporter